MPVHLLSDDELPVVHGADRAEDLRLVGLGVVTARAGRWSGPRRFMPPALAVHYVAVLMVPAFAGVEPPSALEAIWALGYAALAAALVSESAVLRRSYDAPHVPDGSQPVR